MVRLVNYLVNHKLTCANLEFTPQINHSKLATTISSFWHSGNFFALHPGVRLANVQVHLSSSWKAQADGGMNLKLSWSHPKGGKSKEILPTKIQVLRNYGKMCPKLLIRVGSGKTRVDQLAKMQKTHVFSFEFLKHHQHVCRGPNFKSLEDSRG